MSRHARWGDVNAFFGLILDNIAALLLLVVLIGDNSSSAAHSDRFAAWFVLDWIVPGQAIGLFIGAAIYSWLAFRLQRRTGRDDVTAMPLGIDTPTTFAVGLLVLLPTLKAAQTEGGMKHYTASVFAWNVGMAVMVMLGFFKLGLAFFGAWAKKAVPRAALLGPLAAISLALIAFLPMAREVAANPIAGLPTLAVIFVAVMASRRGALRYPGMAIAILIGLCVYVAAFGAGSVLDLQVTPQPDVDFVSRSLPRALPEDVMTGEWWLKVTLKALDLLPLILPFGLATAIGGIECTESAEAAGDSYYVGSIQIGQSLATIVTGACGGVTQPTPYFGHPAYKAMGAHLFYPLAVGLVLALGAYLGLLGQLFTWVPQAVLFPVIIYIGLETFAHSVRATPSRHYPALALAAIPVIAYLSYFAVQKALGNRQPDPAGAAFTQTLVCLANGFVITSILWAAALTTAIDGQRARSAVFLLVAAGCSLFGLIHSPLANAPVAIPTQSWMQELARSLPRSANFQTPYQWAIGYVLAAAIVYFWPHPPGIGAGNQAARESNADHEHVEVG